MKWTKLTVRLYMLGMVATAEPDPSCWPAIAATVLRRVAGAFNLKPKCCRPVICKPSCPNVTTTSGPVPNPCMQRRAELCSRGTAPVVRGSWLVLRPLRRRAAMCSRAPAPTRCSCGLQLRLRRRVPLRVLAPCAPAPATCCSVCCSCAPAQARRALAQWQ
jgi:hypothetical protein